MRTGSIFKLAATAVVAGALVVTACSENSSLPTGLKGVFNRNGGM